MTGNSQERDFQSLETPALPPPLPVVRPRVWTVFVAFGLAQFADILLAVGLLVLMAACSQGWSFAGLWDAVFLASETVTGMLGTIVCTMAIFTVAALVAARLSPVPWRQRLRLQAPGIPCSGWLAGVCGMLAIGSIMVSLDGLSLVPKSPVWEELKAFVRGLSFLNFLAAVVVIGVLPGIAEELLLRGYVQTRLCERWGTRWGVIWTAVMFGVMHMDLVQGTFATAVGLYLGYITAKSGSILPAMVIHAANNSLATLLDRLPCEITGRTSHVVLACIASLVLCVSVWFLHRRVFPGRGTIPTAGNS